MGVIHAGTICFPWWITLRSDLWEEKGDSVNMFFIFDFLALLVFEEIYDFGWSEVWNAFFKANSITYIRTFRNKAFWICITPWQIIYIYIILELLEHLEVFRVCVGKRILVCFPFASWDVDLISVLEDVSICLSRCTRFLKKTISHDITIDGSNLASLKGCITLYNCLYYIIVYIQRTKTCC